MDITLSISDEQIKKLASELRQSMALPTRQSNDESGSIWISKQKYIEQTGFTDGQVRTWIRDSWVRGEHFSIRGRSTAINTEAVERWWVEQAQPAPNQGINKNGKPFIKAVLPQRYRRN